MKNNSFLLFNSGHTEMNSHCHHSSEYKRIFNRVINWGMIHGRSFNLDNIKEENRIMMEFEIFDKTIDSFTNNERNGFVDACRILDYHFNIYLQNEHNPNEVFPYCFDNEDSSSSKIVISASELSETNENDLNSDVKFIGMKNSKSEPTIKNNFDMMNLNNILNED